MADSITFPHKVKSGNVTVTVYRIEHSKARGGYVYELYYRQGGKSVKTQFADLREVLKEAKIAADKLNDGDVAAAGMTKADRDELHALREISGTTPALSAMREWRAAYDRTGGHVLVAAEAWVARGAKKFTPVEVVDGIAKFIAQKDADGAQGTYTYKSKLKPVGKEFAGRQLHTITTPEWQQFLNRIKHRTTRRDIRKRIVSLCRWAKTARHLPSDADLEISATTRVKDEDPKIGLCSVTAWGQLLHYIAKNHPHHLCPLVLAGFGAMRSDEIHGKREDRTHRQVWEDFHLSPEIVDGVTEQPYVVVTIAKKNTPADRHVPLAPAALEWLELCPYPREGNICDSIAIERIRDIGITAGLVLPDNCFRHTALSGRIAITGNKARVATDGGTSVQKLDQNYRRPIQKNVALAWFNMTPGTAAKLPPLKRKTAEQSAASVSI